MTRTRMIRLGCGLGTLAGGLALLGTPAPVHAADIRIGALVNAGRGGTTVGGFVQIGEARRPQMVAAPVVTERVWVSTPRVEIREVPVLDPRGRVVAYRQEREVIADGHWEIVTRPAAYGPMAMVNGGCATAGRMEAGRHGHGGQVEQRYFAPPPGRVPANPGHLRQTAPVARQGYQGATAAPIRDLLQQVVAQARR